MIAIALKTIFALIAVLALIFLAGVTGLLFAAWPTGLGDHSLNVTPVALAKLRELQIEKKFLEDLPNHYPGAPNEVVRARAQGTVDVLLRNLLAELPGHPRRAVVLRAIKVTLASFNSADSEERDQLLRYCERILVTVGIENSGELFNVWRYGFPYGWILRA